MDIGKFILILVGMLVLGGSLTGFIFLELKDSTDYTQFIGECLACHQLNKTYAFCSGACFEPREMDLEIFCAIHPDESCEEVLESA